jgi:hypothetical protein
MSADVSEEHIASIFLVPACYMDGYPERPSREKWS